MADQTKEQLIIEAKLHDLVSKEAARVAQNLRGFSKDVDSIGKSADVGTVKVAGLATRLGGLAARAAGPVAVATAIYKATSAANDFERSLHGVILRVDEGTASMGVLRSSILDISSESGIAREKLAGAGADVLRIFSRDGLDAMVILREVSRVAQIAGQDEAASFAQVAQVLDSFKLSAREAGTVSEQLFATALEGKANFGDMAAVMAGLGPLARALGFDFRQTSAVLTAMAADAGGVNEAGSALQSLFRRLLADRELQQRLQAVGAGFDADARSGNSLIGVLRGLQEATGGSQNELTALLGGARNAAAAMALTSADSTKLDAALGALATSASVVDQKFRAIGDLADTKLDRLGNKISNWAVLFGDAFKDVKDKFVNDFLPDLPEKSFAQNFAESLRTVEEHMRNAAALRDEAGLQKWTEDYKNLAEAATAAGIAQEVGVKSLESMSIAIEKAQRAQVVTATPETQAKAAELLLAINAKMLTGLEQQAAQHEVIYGKIQQEISAYEDAGVNVAKLRGALATMKQANTDRLELATTRDRLALEQQLSAQTQRGLEVEQQRARALGEFDRASELGEQILLERARVERASSELTIAGLEEQRRVYPQLAQAIDQVIGKIRERQFVEGQQARDAMSKANQDAIDQAADLRLSQAREAADAARMAFAAEQQLVELRVDGLMGLERELAQIEANHAASIERAREEAKFDEEKAKRLESLILLMDGEAARQQQAAQDAARADFLRMESDLVSRTASSRAEQVLAMERIRTLERESLLVSARELGATEEELRFLEARFDLESRRIAESIAGGFREGMSSALVIYADTAQRMFESGQDFIRSFHDEGARSLSDLFKGNLSGRDALRQFGQGVLGNVIDSSSSAIFDTLTTSIFGVGDQISAAGQQAAGGIQGAGGFITSALQGLGSGLSGLLQGLFGGVSASFIGPIPQADGGVWGGALLPVRAAGGGVFGRRTLLEVAEVAGRQEAVVPMHRGGIVADMGSRGPRVRVAGADIPLSFRGGGSGGTTVNVSPTANVTLVVHALDPRGATEAVLAQMPHIQRAITAALTRGSDRQLRDAVQSAAR